MQRSIERDFDINYYCRSAHQHMDDLVGCIDMLVAVDHSPYPLMRALEEQWLTLKEKYKHILS